MIPTGQRLLQNWVMFYRTRKSAGHRQIWNSWMPSFNRISFARGIRWLTSWLISSSPPLRLMSYHQVCIQQFKTIQDVPLPGEVFHKQDQWWAKPLKAQKVHQLTYGYQDPLAFQGTPTTYIFCLSTVLTTYLDYSGQYFGWESFRHRRPRDHIERTGTTFPSSSMHLCMRCSDGDDTWRG